MAKALLTSVLTTTLCVGCAAPVTDDAADEASLGAAAAADDLSEAYSAALLAELEGV